MRQFFLVIACFITVAGYAQPMRALVSKKTIAASGNTAFITSSPSGALRNDFTSSLGFGFTVGAADITITDLGRWIISGNSGTHTLRLVNAANTTLVSASINTSGLTAGGFSYVSCTPTVLTAGTTYYMLSDEVSGGDQWYDIAVTSTAVATVIGSAYTLTGTITNNANGAKSYVTVNFKYHL